MDQVLFSKLRKYLESDSEVELALLFGSQARGDATDQSDVDVAISIGRPLSPDEYGKRVLELSSICGKEIDLVDLRVADSLISRQALTEGVILKRKDPQVFAAFLKRALLDEADLGPAREKILAARRKKAFDVG